MGTFATEAENYLEAESYEERKEIGLRMDKKYWDIVNNRRGVMRIYTPFLRGDREFDWMVSDLINDIFNPLWSLTSFLSEGPREDAVLEQGKELSENEAAFFAAILSELKEFRYINEGEINTLNRGKRKEIIEESRELLQRAQELSGEYLNN